MDTVWSLNLKLMSTRFHVIHLLLGLLLLYPGRQATEVLWHILQLMSLLEWSCGFHDWVVAILLKFFVGRLVLKVGFRLILSGWVAHGEQSKTILICGFRLLKGIRGNFWFFSYCGLFFIEISFVVHIFYDRYKFVLVFLWLSDIFLHCCHSSVQNVYLIVAALTR